MPGFPLHALAAMLRIMSRRPAKPAAPPARASEDDLALFHEAIGPVRRIEVEGPAAAAPKPAPRPRSREADEVQAGKDFRLRPFEFAADTLGDTLEYLADGHSPKLMRDLKRGRYAVQDELDLHRMRVDEAEAALRAFLGEARRAQFPCVRLVHGKGLRSEAGPVLKALVDRVLRHRGDVLAFASAPAAQGGTGATLVLLRGP